MLNEGPGGAFGRYMEARLEQNAALLEWMRASGEDEAEPWRRAEAARLVRDAAADEFVGLLMQDPFSARAEYDTLKARLRSKCDDDTWTKMMEHLQALDETFDAEYRRTWLNVATRRYLLPLVVGLVLGGALVATLTG